MASGAHDIHLEAITDRIYEASVLPETWESVLEAMTGVAGGAGAILLAADMTDFRYISTEGLSGFVDSFVSEGWIDRNTRTPAVLRARHAGFIVEEDIYTPDEIARDRLINGFLRPRGLGWATATAFPMTTGDTLVFSVERRYQDGPVPREAVAVLDRIRPHLGRAALISARLRLERAHAAVETLALLGLPAGIVSRGLRLQAANDLLHAMIPRVVRDGNERVGFSDAAADALLAGAFAIPGRPAARSIPIPARGEDAATVVHLVPVRGAARDVFLGSAYLLVLTPVQQPGVPGPDLLQGLFDLTGAEARVVRGILAGETVKTIAGRASVEPDTVRSQLRQVFAKTGVTRQVDLVRLLSGLSLSGGA